MTETIDAHAHVGVPFDKPKRTRHLLDLADRFGIQWLWISMGPLVHYSPTQRQVRESNDHVLRLMKRWPNRFVGYCYLNPKHGRACRRELLRCVKAGMRGIKLWMACACDSPLVFPIVEDAIELGQPIMQHTWKITAGNEKNHSQPQQMANLAARFPQATFIMAHAGGNWDYGVRAIHPYPNVLIDTSGGNPTQGIVEMALRRLGPNRIIFGSDASGRSFASQLAKIHGAAISPRARRMILHDNAAALLWPCGY